MKQLLFLALLVSSLTYAHPVNEDVKKETYEFLQKQVQEGKITLETAQKMWIAYIRCCEDI